MRALLLSFACIQLLVLGEGIEEPADSKVNVVTYDNFNRFIKKNPLVIMEFYAPWCGHCQHLAPIYRDAAKLVSEADLPNPVVFAKFNDGNEYNRQLRGGAEDMFNYTGYPALLIFKKKKIPVANSDHWKKTYMKRQWQFYGGGRDKPEDFLFYLSAISKGLDPFDEERKMRPGFYKKGGKHATDAIIELEPDGATCFNETVLAETNNVLWIVEFYSDHCPFCNSLAPEITAAAKTVQGEYGTKIKFGAVNSRVYHEIAEQVEVTSYPWVTSFYAGAKVEDMAGLGGAESVVRFSKEMYDKAYKTPYPDNTFVSTQQPVSEEEQLERNKLEVLLVEAKAFNLKSANGVEKMRERAKTDGIATVIAELESKLAPVHELKARLAKHEEL